jgi:hypothetical protein
MQIETTSHLRATIYDMVWQKEGCEVQSLYFLTAKVFANMA